MGEEAGGEQSRRVASFPWLFLLVMGLSTSSLKEVPETKTGWEHFTCDVVSPCTNERVMTAGQGGRKSIPRCALVQPSSAGSWGSTQC